MYYFGGSWSCLSALEVVKFVQGEYGLGSYQGAGGLLITWFDGRIIFWVFLDVSGKVYIYIILKLTRN